MGTIITVTTEITIIMAISISNIIRTTTMSMIMIVEYQSILKQNNRCGLLEEKAEFPIVLCEGIACKILTATTEAARNTTIITVTTKITIIMAISISNIIR